MSSTCNLELTVHCLATLPDTVFRTVSLAGAPAMRPIALLFLYSGFSNGFWSGVLTEQLSTDLIGLAMVVVGVAEVLGGLFYGKLIVGRVATFVRTLCDPLCLR